MTSWILPEKEKPPSVDSDFSCIVLTVYKLTQNDFHSNTADVVHPLHPQHLIFRKRGLPLRPLFRKAILPAEKTLLLPADQCQQDNCSVCHWLADWCNAPCGGFSDTDGAVVPICRYALRFPPAISGKADNSRLVTHTKSRSSRYRCTCPLYVPPNKDFASKSSPLSAKYCVLRFCPHLGSLMFYTITNLQGSQTE